MKYYMLYRLPRWGVLLSLLLLAFVVTPASVAYGSTGQNAHVAHKLMQNAANSSLQATVYLETAALRPVFQKQIDAQVPAVVNDAMQGMVKNLPETDQQWAKLMAETLVQPSATLVNLVPQKEGLVATLRLNLYPGDPKPIQASMLVKMSVADASTIQLSAQPMPGSPTLVNGPLSKLQMPLGQLNSITPVSACGDAALALKLQFPLASEGEKKASISTQPAHILTSLNSVQPVTVQQERQTAATSMKSHVEISSSSLSAMGSSIGTLALSENLSAENIQMVVQGKQLAITSDILLGSLKLGQAITYVQPQAVQGKLVAKVEKTELSIFSILTFPYNSYNKQIEQSLNEKFNAALTDKFTVTNAAIGKNSQVPCAASDSLLLTGTTNLVL